MKNNQFDFEEYLENVRKEEYLGNLGEYGIITEKELQEYEILVEKNTKAYNHFSKLLKMVDDEFITVNAGLNGHSQQYAMAEEVLMVAGPDWLDVELNGEMLNAIVNNILENDDYFNETWNNSCVEAIRRELNSEPFYGVD